MSRNLSLKKIVPHLRSYSVKKSDQSVSSTFAQEFTNKEEISSEEKDSDTQEDHRENSAESAKTNQDGNLPEIFQLIENPDFRELFDLSVGKKERFIRLILQKYRKERGVSEEFPIPYQNAINLNKKGVYRQSIEWYHNHKSSSILFSM